MRFERVLHTLSLRLKLFPQRAVRINAGYGHSYEIFLLDPKSGRALVQGGKYFAEPVEATVSSSTFGGCMLRLGWIGVGVLRCGGRHGSNGHAATRTRSGRDPARKNIDVAAVHLTLTN